MSEDEGQFHARWRIFSSTFVVSKSFRAGRVDKNGTDGQRETDFRNMAP